MSINQLSLEASRLKIQLQAMPSGTPEYFRVLAQYQYVTTALGGARGGIRTLNF